MCRVAVLHNASKLGYKKTIVVLAHRILAVIYQRSKSNFSVCKQKLGMNEQYYFAHDNEGIIDGLKF